MKLTILVVTLLATIVAASTPSNLPWPAPKEYTSNSTTVMVAGRDAFSFSAPQSVNTLKAAFDRYLTLAFPHRSLPLTSGSSATVKMLIFQIDSYDESAPQVDTDESYTLDIGVDGSASATAKTVYGAMRALETFSQLVVFNFTSETYFIPNCPWKITDAPRFPHRGLMIDSARHFETLSAIREIIDSLPYSKFNVLHWHMVDSQSFPFQSKTYPKLWDGSYTDQEKFTQLDIEDIVEYARMRGVRVMVEFDVPGHAQSWCVGYPEICPSTTCTTPLNVANNKTFEVIQGLIGECTGPSASTPGHPQGLFHSNMIHLGGDEVDTACWTKTPSINSWLDENHMTADQGYAYFAKRVADMAIKNGHRPVQWSEVYDHFKTELPKEVIVHIWKDVTNVTEVVANGYNVLLNVGYDSKSWYLDNLNVKWDAVYSNEPCTGVPDNLCPLILGGQGEMWGETVDPSDLDQTVWPRLAAIGERLWSPRTYTDTSAALPRIEHFRCLLNRRGVRAAPVNNAVARSAPPGPGSCYVQ